MAAENASLHAQLKEDRLEAFKVYAEEAGKVAEQNSKTVQNVAVAPASTASAAEKGLQIFAQGGQMAASISAPQVQHTLQLT